MSNLPPPSKRVQEEAAAWFARLNRRQVPLASLEAFRAWRQRPGNRAAYADVEGLWREAAELQGDAEIRKAVSSALARPAGRRGWTRAILGPGWRPALGVTAVALVGLAVAIGLQIRSAGAIYATKLGEQRLVRLEDGSRVRLDTDTRLAVRFGKGERRLRLERGQAFFEVAHDTSRPFVVEAGQTRVRAVGTRFDVRRDDGQVRVILVEGIVQVRDDAPARRAAWTLKPGEQLTTGASATPRPVDVTAATSWTTGRVVFQAVPLVAAIAEINRYGAHKIRLAAPGVGQVPVTGVFDAGDTDAFVAAVSDLHDLRPSRQPDGVILLSAAPAAAN